MYVDNCQHTFEELAQYVLPEHMKRLDSALAAPTPLAQFAVPGRGPATIAKALGRTRDFSGCYVLLEKDSPKYVGISRKVLSRLRQHVLGRTHFDASLAYLIAQRSRPTSGHRDRVMEHAEFQAAFAEAQSYLRSLSAAFVEIENPVELYVFEAYAALSLRTFEWNTFRTH
jgi:hypothetical protein